jgi:hypothetical protein
MVTKAQIMALSHGAGLHFTGRHKCTRTIGPRGGVTENVTAVRVSGQVQTWKTRPEDFRVPVKYGMYESSEVTQSNAGDWHIAADCPLLRTDGEVK